MKYGYLLLVFGAAICASRAVDRRQHGTQFGQILTDLLEIKRHVDHCGGDISTCTAKCKNVLIILRCLNDVPSVPGEQVAWRTAAACARRAGFAAKTRQERKQKARANLNLCETCVHALPCA